MEENNKCCENLTPLNMNLFSQSNTYRNVIGCIKRAKQLEFERERRNHQKLDEWITYVNNSYNDDNKVADISPQIKISRYFEKLPKVTNIALREFCNNDFVITNKEEEEEEEKAKEEKK